jgi:hypothetical protein
MIGMNLSKHDSPPPSLPHFKERNGGGEERGSFAKNEMGEGKRPSVTIIVRQLPPII